MPNDKKCKECGRTFSGDGACCSDCRLKPVTKFDHRMSPSEYKDLIVRGPQEVRDRMDIMMDSYKRTRGL